MKMAPQVALIVPGTGKAANASTNAANAKVASAKGESDFTKALAQANAKHQKAQGKDGVSQNTASKADTSKIDTTKADPKHADETDIASKVILEGEAIEMVVQNPEHAGDAASDASLLLALPEQAARAVAPVTAEAPAIDVASRAKDDHTKPISLDASLPSRMASPEGAAALARPEAGAMQPPRTVAESAQRTGPQRLAPNTPLAAQAQEVTPAQTSPAPSPSATAHASLVVDNERLTPQGGAATSRPTLRATYQATHVDSASRASARTPEVGPDTFMRHLDQSIQVAGLMGADRQHAMRATDLPASMLAELSARGEHAALAASSSVAGPQGGAMPASVAATPVYTVGAHIEHEGWARAMSQQVVSFMKRSANGEHSAQLRLDPPNLGPIRVSITLADGVAHAVFGAANVVVRQALEQALPELSRSMSEAGLSLGQADVGDGEAGQFDGMPGGQGRAQGSVLSAAASRAGANELVPEALTTPSAHEGLVNTFA